MLSHIDRIIISELNERVKSREATSDKCQTDLAAVVQVTPDVMSSSLCAPRSLVDLDTGVYFLLLTDGVGISVNPSAVAAFQRCSNRCQVVK